MMQTTTISIVIPVFNESENISRTVAAVRESIKGLAEHYEIILIDDGSWDQTWKTMKTVAASDPRIKLIRFSRNFGKEAAILAGLKYSSGDAVVVMDADLQHPPQLLEAMVDAWKNRRYKIVHAVKIQRQSEHLWQRIPARVFYWLMNVLSGYDLRGATDYKLLDREVVDHYLRLPEKVRFFRGLIPWLGFRATALPFAPGQRQFGETSWPAFSLITLGVRAICSFSAIPMQVVTLLGALVFLGATVLGVQALYMKWSGRAVEGFTTVIILILAIGSVLMVSFGIIGQYIALIYEEIKGRPPFIISELDNFPNPSSSPSNSGSPHAF